MGVLHQERPFGIMFRMKMVVIACGIAALAGCETELENGAAAYRATDAIVVARCPKTSDYGTNWFCAAAADLTNVLAKVTGRAVPLYAEGAEPKGAKAAIYFGDTAAAREAGIDTAALRRMVFRLKTERGKTYIAANSATASSYGMTEFVERYCDYHFLMLHGDDPYTVNPALTIPTADLTVTPAIYWRKIWTQFLHNNRPREECERSLGDKKLVWRNYFRRTRTYGLEEEWDPDFQFTRRAPFAHSTYAYLDPEKYFKDHPEYFSLRKEGRRQAKPVGELCLTNPDVRRIVTENLLKMVAADRAERPHDYPKCYPFSLQDNNPYICWCDNCRAIVEKYNRKKGGNQEGGDTALYMDFINDIARRVKTAYPDVRLLASAYVNTEIVPETLSFDENVIVEFCDVYSYSEELHPLKGTPINRPQYDKLVAWSKAAKHLGVWDYRMTRLFPQVNVDAVCEDVRLFRDCGADMFFMEHDYMENDPFWELHHYLYTRLSMDPDLDLEKLLDTFCRSYGENAKPMRAVIDFMRREIAAHPAKTFGAWFNRDLGWRSRAYYERLLAMVKPCYDREKDPLRRGRIAGLLRAIYSELLPMYFAARDGAAKFEESKALYARYVDESYAVSEMPKSSVTYWKDRALAHLMKYSIEFKDLPDELKGVPREELVCLDSDGMMAAREYRRTDKTSETGKAVRYHGMDAVNPPFKFDIMSSSGEVFYDVEVPKGNQDGKYHWHKYGPYRMGRYGKLHCPTFVNGVKVPPGRTPSFRLQDYFKDDDGIPTEESPNWYDIYVSCKWSPKSATNDDDGFYVDRLVMRRVKPYCHK